jgi:sterol desaturase/sphingolipid hydroxylase (fatty acid hydroxylase superfamily)
VAGAILAWLEGAPWWQLGGAFLLENAFLLLAAVVIGEWLAGRLRLARASGPAHEVTWREWRLAGLNVLLNTAITLLGCWLWRQGIIRFRRDTGIGAWLDVLVLLLAMDLAMYLLHRLAHLPGLYALAHETHHRYEAPRPLTLFLLNPIENLAFGVLWLAAIAVYESSWLGMMVYLALNLASGTIGHLGVDVLPEEWRAPAAASILAGSRFHGRHHADRETNFGFYTVLWDRLLGTCAGI